MSRAAASLAVLVVACSARHEDPPRAVDPRPALPAPLLPATPAQFAPSQASVEGGGAVTGRDLADVEACANCHDDIVAQWRTSAHAFASFNNPIYRTSVDRFRSEIGREPSRFCAGCHDVALLVDRAMDADVEAGDPRAFAGVTCRTCHGVVQTRPDGNGSYVLSAAAIPIPDMNDPASVARHKESAAPAPLRTAELCGSCHRAFLDESTGNSTFLAGMDEYGAWSRSGYAGSKLARVDVPVAPTTCQGCHMPREATRMGDVASKGGTVRSHRFVGAHSWLAAMRGDADALRRERQNLVDAASIDVAVAIASDGTRTMPADGAPVVPGERLVLDVVVRNLRVGHRFPGGTLDAEDVWIELVVRDRAGHTIAEAGTRHEASDDDPTAHVLRALVAGEDGTPLLTRETHRFRAVVYNHTVLPRDAEVVEYAFDVPAALDPASLPLRVEARLRHRSRDLALQRVTCDDAKTGRGRAFARATRERAGKSLDPCAPQPVTELARAEVWLGEGALARGDASTTKAPRPRWSRLFDHGLAEQHNVQERLDVGRASLEAALALLEEAGTYAERSMVLTALAWLPAHEGRTAEAMAWIDRAEQLAPGHPALASLRGTALEQVWRWGEALEPLRVAGSAAPRDDAVAARLAVALGSVGDEPGALAAARRGLLLAPRDADLLRVQALAERALTGSAPDADAAESAYLACRPADDAPDIRSACAAKAPGCALERVPVHVHVMRP